MNPSIVTIIEILKQQGFSFLLMGAMLWYLSNQLDQEKETRREEIKVLKTEIQACNQAQQQLMLNQIDKSNRLLDKYETNHVANPRQRHIMATD